MYIPIKAHTTSLSKWYKLLELLRRITPATAGSRGIITRVQNALTRAYGRHIYLTSYVHDKLEAWYDLFRSLASMPTHLRKLQRFPLT